MCVRFRATVCSLGTLRRGGPQDDVETGEALGDVFGDAGPKDVEVDIEAGMEAAIAQPRNHMNFVRNAATNFKSAG